MERRRTIKESLLNRVCAELHASRQDVCQQLHHVLATMERLSASSEYGVVENSRLIAATGFGSDRASHLIYALHMSRHLKWCPKVAKNRIEGWALQ